MAEYELKNKKLAIRVESLGAELKSLKTNENGTEYMWSADPEYWPRTAPILFPFIGRLKNSQYRYKGKTYTISPHGFARDTEFELAKRTENSLLFEIKDSEKTREVYPFPFILRLCYELEDHSLKVKYFVKNTGNDLMLFSIGGHPGFNCPLKGTAEKRSECFLLFKGKQPLTGIHCRDIDMSTGLAKNTFTDFSLNQGKLQIKDDLFKDDALVLENQIDGVSILGKNGKPYLTFQMDAPVYGIWSCVKEGSPFVCIEPWFGRCDRTDFEGSLEEREFQNSLKPGETFEKEYRIILENI